MGSPGLHDCHAHLADQRVAGVLGDILARFQRAGGHCIAATAARRSEWERIATMADGSRVIGAIGVHPWFVADWREPTAGELALALAANPAIRAVGEIGLDFQNGRTARDRQIEAFAAQLEVAVTRSLPAVFHNRRSWPDFLAIVDGFGGRVSGVCHGFTGSRELARDLLERGLFLSFGGPLTNPRSRRARDAAAYAPADRILTESDTPDLPPFPRTAEQSSPADVARVLAVLAESRGVSIPVLAEQIAANFHRVFGTTG